ncbi:MAG: hypothetical protein Q8N13_11015 [Acidovorax sp.]|nr:hypothetical protein [Acidovorax sp.]
MSASLTLAPMSPVVAKLWHQLQAAMLKETHGLDVVPAGAIVLQPLPQDRRVTFESGCYDSTILSIGDGDNSDTFTKYWTMPPRWDRFWDQAHWRLNVSRTGPDGPVFSASGGAYVIDDFGDLVKVPE